MSTENLTEFKDRIKLAREQAGLSRDALGKKLKISGAYIGQLESGKKENPSELFLDQFSKELGVNLVWLKSGQGEMKRGENSVFEDLSVYKINYDEELTEIMDLLMHDVPEDKPLVLQLLRGRKEAKEAILKLHGPIGGE